MRTAANGVRRHQAILGVLFAAASAVFLLAVHYLEIASEVATVYFPYADQLMNGTIPDMEYPPFAMVFIGIPRIFASTPFGYEIAFAALVFIFFAIGLIITAKLAKRYYHSQYTAMILYTALTLLLLEFVLDRYDFFPAILTLLSFYCLVTKRYVWAFLLLSVATMTKLYPAVLFPVYLIPLLFNRDWKNALKGTGVFVAVALLTVLPFILTGSDAVTYFLSYHMDRPLQIESAAASIIAVFSNLGITETWVEFGFGSDNLMGPWPDAVAPYLTPLMLAALGAVYVLYAYLLSGLRKYNIDNENNRLILLGGAALLAVLAFMIFGKVFSAQYIVWAVPFIIFMLMTAIDREYKRALFLLTVTVIALSQLAFAVNSGLSGGGAEINAAGMMIILAKNIAAIVLFAYVVRIMKGAAKKKQRLPAPPDA
jgi:hypothetical protein